MYRRHSEVPARSLTSESYDGIRNTVEFRTDISQKTREKSIGRQEATIEAITNKHVEEKGGKDNALLYVVSNLNTKLPLLVNTLILKGADTSAVDCDGRTPLHHAVTRHLRVVAAKLLEHDASPKCRDNYNVLPFAIAFEHRNDDMCALLLSYMPNEFVRSIFIGDTDEAEFSLHVLLESETSMQQTVISVLDCMLEPRGPFNSLCVYYNLLESDESGRPPSNSLFDNSKKSPFQIIAKQGNKNIVYHDTVRLLVRRKWNDYAERKFVVSTLWYAFALFCISFSAIVSATVKDATVYNGPLQIARAVLEVVSLVMICKTLFQEIYQLCRHLMEYFHDKFNWLDILSSVLLLTVPVLRFTHTNAQWYVFAFGYILWTIRIFKYAAVFRQTGAYAQILQQILQHGFLQFGALFLVILLAFSVSFSLSLKGDGDLDKHVETSTFWGILFVGIRTLTEAAPVVEYTGPDGFAPVSAIFMVAFLFTCIVILRTILIAQLSDTYQKVQQDAQRGLEVNRAWIIAKVELTSIPCVEDLRKKHYVENEDIKDITAVLEESESSPLNEMNKYIRDIRDSLENHQMNILTIQHRMARQDEALREFTDHHRMSRHDESLQPTQEQIHNIVNRTATDNEDQDDSEDIQVENKSTEMDTDLSNINIDNKENITETKL